jgi:parallel beta-helix repeat protein
MVLLLISTSFVGVSYTADNSSSIPFNGNILYVGGSGEGNYTKIQDAIDNASDGDTVFVYSGLYNETLEISNSINLIGEDRENTFIDGMKKDVLLIRGYCSGIKINGFCIQNGEDGIYVSSKYNLEIISDCEISNNIIKNIRKLGVDIVAIPCKRIIVKDNIFFNCSKGRDDGALFLGLAINCVVSNNIFYNNGLGASIYGRYSKVTRNQIDGNGVGLECGGIGGYCLVRRNNITNNDIGFIGMLRTIVIENNFINNSVENLSLHVILIFGILWSRFFHNYYDDWKGYGVKWVFNLGYIIDYWGFTNWFPLLLKCDLFPARKPFDI